MKSNHNVSWKNFALTLFYNRRMLTALIMGFVSGLPLLLTMGVLQAWMKEDGIDLTVIGFMSLVQIPYTWKFLWAPFIDRYTLPFLGRRRGWILIIQIALMMSIVLLGFANPSEHFIYMVYAAVLVAFLSASQDIVLDAYRREDLPDEELGLGTSIFINGYRLGMILSGGIGMILADYMPFSKVYMIMGLCMVPGILTTLMAPEPKIDTPQPKSMTETVIDPLVDYFKRSNAIWILAFILFYKLGDTMAMAMTTPFYLDIGFTKGEIGWVAKLYGTCAVIGGAFIGGVVLYHMGINRSLWIFGFFQATSILGFYYLARIGNSLTALCLVIAFENLSSGMGTSAFATFMASLTNKKFTGTQYALLSSLMGVPRVIVASFTGYLAKSFGWENFFIFCTAMAIPGILLLLKFAPWHENEKETSVGYNPNAGQ